MALIISHSIWDFHCFQGGSCALESGFQLVQMGRALLRDPDFVNKMKIGVESCGCGHSNYCIGRMYSKEMACHHNLKEPLPAKLIKEIEQLESR